MSSDEKQLSSVPATEPLAVNARPKVRLCRRILKYMSVSLLALLLLLGGTLYYLGFTLSGAQQAFALAQKFTDGIIGLEGEIVDGCLWSGLEVKQVAVTVPNTVKVEAAQLRLSYTLLPALTRGHFTADEIAADKLRVTLLENGTVPEPEVSEVESAVDAANDTPFRLHFPLELEVGRLRVNDFAFLSSIVDVKVAAFSALLQAVDDSALMQDALAAGVLVHLKSSADQKVQSERLAARLSAPARGEIAARWQDAESEPEPPNNVNSFDDGQGLIARMPTVALPLDITVLNLTIEKGRYYQDGFDTETVNTLHLTATWHNTLLSVLKLDASHPRGALLISGAMDFRDHFYLDFNLSGAGAIVDENRLFLGGVLYGLQGRAKVKGTLTDLNAEIDLLNPRDTHVQARLNCLSSLLPMELTVAAPQLEYPLFSAERAQLSVRDLKLTAQGDILGLGFDSTLQTLFSGYGFADYAVDFAGHVSLQGVDIAKLNLSGEYLRALVEAQAQGRVDYADTIGFAGKLQFLASDGGVLATQLKGPLSAQAELTAALVQPATEPGAQQDLNVFLDVPAIAAHFNLNGIAAQLQLQELQGSLLEGFALKGLTFSQGTNRVEVNGQIAAKESSQLNGIIDLRALESLAPGVTGDLQATLQAAGTLDTLDLHISGHSDRIMAGSTRLRNVAFDGSFNRAEQSFALTGMINTLRLVQGLKPARQCVLDLSGNSARHNLSFVCGGENSIFVSAAGALDEALTQWRGELEEFYFNSELSGSVNLADSVQLVVDFTKGSGEVSAFELRTDAGSMSVGRTQFGPGELTSSVHFNQVDLKSLNDLLPEGMHMSGPVQLDSQVKIQQGRPDITVELASDNARIFAAGVPLIFDKLRFNSTLQPQQAVVNADISLKGERGSAALNLKVLDPLNTKRLDGQFTLKDLNLSLFMGVGTLFNDLQGKLNIDGGFSGNLSRPLFNGEIKMLGSAEPRYDIGQIDSFDITLQAHGQAGSLSGFIGLNEGRLNLNGELDWSQGANGELQVTARRLPTFLLGFGQAYADIDAQASFNDYFDVSGRVTIPQALISVSSLGSSGAAPSSDEILVPEGGTSVLMQEVSAPVPSRVNLTVAMGDDVRVSAMGLTARLDGELMLHKELTASEVSGSGGIDLLDGKAELYGHHFYVNHARANFNGPLSNPSLDVEIVADPEEMEDNVLAGVRVGGDALSPQIALFSKPSMSQNEIMSYLLYGHGLDKSTNLNEGSNASMLVGLGVSSVGSLVNSLVGAFGVQDVRVNASGSGEETQVQVQGYITRRIRVGYGYGVFNAVGEFKLRYEFMRRLYAEFVSSVDQAVDIIYSFEF